MAALWVGYHYCYEHGEEQSTVGYARTNVIGYKTSFVIALFVLEYIEIYVFRDNPFLLTAYSTVTIQHNHLNNKNILHNKKYKCNNNIKLIYLAFMHCR
jgi:hypothetical protein